MAKSSQRSGRRALRLVHKADPASTSAQHEWQDIAADSGMDVSDLMREVAQFRVALEADMTIAAAAAELGETEIAADLIDAERRHLADFEVRAHDALLRGNDLVHAPRGSNTPRREIRFPRAFAAAAAAAAIVGSLGLVVGNQHGKASSTGDGFALAAAARYADFSRLATGDSTASAMIAAASLLHDSLADLVINDPTSAEQVAGILNNEQRQLLLWLPPGTTTVLADAKALVARLRLTAPGRAGQVIGEVQIESPPKQSSHKPAPQQTAKPTSTPTPKPTATPTPKPTDKPSPKPTPSPTASPSRPNPSASPSPSGSPIIPGAPQNPIR